MHSLIDSGNNKPGLYVPQSVNYIFFNMISFKLRFYNVMRVMVNGKR